MCIVCEKLGLQVFTSVYFRGCFNFSWFVVNNREQQKHKLFEAVTRLAVTPVPSFGFILPARKNNVKGAAVYVRAIYIHIYIYICIYIYIFIFWSYIRKYNMWLMKTYFEYILCKHTYTNIYIYNLYMSNNAMMSEIPIIYAFLFFMLENHPYIYSGHTAG